MRKHEKGIIRIIELLVQKLGASNMLRKEIYWITKFSNISFLKAFFLKRFYAYGELQAGYYIECLFSMKLQRTGAN